MNSPIRSARSVGNAAAARPGGSAATPAEATHADRRRAALPALDANALELFARVVAAGSFAEAARRLGLTRAAVSRRLAAIEQQAGVALLVRTTRSLGLTEAGRRLAGHARTVLEAAEGARRSVRSGRAALEGRLRVTSVPSFGRAMLMPLLARFQARHPGVRFELLLSDRPVDLLREGIDVAFRLTRKPPPDWLAQPLMPLRVGAYATPALCPQALAGPAALAGLPLLLLGAATDSAPLLWQHPALAAQRVEVSPAVWSEDMDSLVALARAGAGVVLAPDWCVQAELRRGELLDLLPGWQLPVAEGDTLWALTLPALTAPPSARALVKFVREACASAGAQAATAATPS